MPCPVPKGLIFTFSRYLAESSGVQEEKPGVFRGLKLGAFTGVGVCALIRAWGWFKDSSSG